MKIIKTRICGRLRRVGVEVAGFEVTLDLARGPRPRLRKDDGGRFLLWPISVERGMPGCWHFGQHGWELGAERVDFEDTAIGNMPGYRSVYGQTIHLGPIRVSLGPLGERPSWLPTTSIREVERRALEYRREVEAGRVRPLHVVWAERGLR